MFCIYRVFCKTEEDDEIVESECEGATPDPGHETCTLAVFDPVSLLRVDQLPDNVPDLCSDERLAALEITGDDEDISGPVLSIFIPQVSSYLFLRLYLLDYLTWQEF